MTSTAADPRSDALILKLHELRSARDVALSELAADASGDVADRATNVDANVRFALLEQRIHALEVELANGPAARPSDGRVTVGDVVTLDLGDGPESFLYGPVEHAAPGLDVVTPSSPLGVAIEGATAGTTVTYRIRSRELTAKVVAVS